MKILKMKVQRSHPKGPEGGTHYNYPPQWNASVIKFIDYEPNVKGKGRDWQYVTIGVPDIHVSKFLEANGYMAGGFTFEAVELNDTEADILMDEWHPDPPPIKKDDENRINAILAKIGKKEDLTQEDLDALDPEKPTRGLRRAKGWKEAMHEAKQRF